jgi:hypothetical protein
VARPSPCRYASHTTSSDETARQRQALAPSVCGLGRRAHILFRSTTSGGWGFGDRDRLPDDLLGRLETKLRRRRRSNVPRPFRPAPVRRNLPA